MKDSYYESPIRDFLATPANAVLGKLARVHHHSLERQQRSAWLKEIEILKNQLSKIPQGHIFIEFLIPRMGKRADVVIVHNNIIFIVEFKIGSTIFDAHAIEQVYDYALDLKNFHLGTHDLPVVPVLVSESEKTKTMKEKWHTDFVSEPLLVGKNDLASIFNINNPIGNSVKNITIEQWRLSGYRPTPTIIEAAEVLYNNHEVKDIYRSDAEAINLQTTSEQIAKIIEESKRKKTKSICFITGVPGAGKTLAGLNIAAKRAKKHKDEHAVFLSGNGPLVQVLREALARDQAKRENITKSNAERSVKKFIQNIHTFRDYYVDRNEIPFEKVVVFDEAQRAWTQEQASKFMKKRGYDNFEESEPEFLISAMNRHTDWCVIICLIGGGQEINTGEAGISEWLTALKEKFSKWEVHASEVLEDKHYTIDKKAAEMLKASNIKKYKDLHLPVSMRSFRVEQLSGFVSQLLDSNIQEAQKLLSKLLHRYPIVLTRNINDVRSWLREKARGGERYGIVASSGAQRLRPEGIHVKEAINPANWFLNNRFDVRSSYYMEEVATQFDIQGLELDWVGVCWGADLRCKNNDWQFHTFKGTKWLTIRDETKKLYLLNAYRVLLTRARQGMIIFVPQGSKSDPTRPPEYYDQTFQFLQDCGIKTLPTPNNFT